MKTISKPLENSAKTLESIRALVTEDLAAVDALIHTELSSSVPLTREITQHIFKGKGKRIRPLLVILASHALSNMKNLTVRHYELATVIEFVHTATLLHDDVVDHSEKRRGQTTANAIWGNAGSVLVGDFLYSRAFQILARHQQPTIMQVLSKTTNAIAEGEVMQLMNQHDPMLTRDNYFHVITQKTAQLFSAAAEVGAILAKANPTQQQAIADYGLYLGIAFQIIDDILDYQASAEEIGKNIGDDLAEGKATLPLIIALEKTTNEKSALIRAAIQQGDSHCLSQILKILQETNALSDAQKQALRYANQARASLNNIPDSLYRNALTQLTQFSVTRGF